MRAGNCNITHRIQIKYTTFNSEEKPNMMAQFTGDTVICNENILLKKKDRKKEKNSF